MLLHWFPTPDEYDALTLVELEEFRSVCHELTKKR